MNKIVKQRPIPDQANFITPGDLKALATKDEAVILYEKSCRNFRTIYEPVLQRCRCGGTVADLRSPLEHNLCRLVFGKSLDGDFKVSYLPGFPKETIYTFCAEKMNVIVTA